ncbi:hypothetical protein QJS04_geneDACA008209 [Acorus gramineus]|uniref:Uncharacterized protein n=1 Tax=Acorus gramineus TaxID=55184 RepID=A0AAV9AZB4_ACOGR|nr:hypothetical protein QJS04_geneDACA008209 [Acorus gramineus]
MKKKKNLETNQVIYSRRRSPYSRCKLTGNKSTNWIQVDPNFILGEVESQYTKATMQSSPQQSK